MSKKETEKVTDRPIETSVGDKGKAANGSAGTGTAPQVAVVADTVVSAPAINRPPNRNELISPTSSIHMSHMLLQSPSTPGSENVSRDISRNNSDDDLLRKR